LCLLFILVNIVLSKLIEQVTWESPAQRLPCSPGDFGFTW